MPNEELLYRPGECPYCGSEIEVVLLSESKVKEPKWLCGTICREGDKYQQSKKCLDLTHVSDDGYWP